MAPPLNGSRFNDQITSLFVAEHERRAFLTLVADLRRATPIYTRDIAFTRQGGGEFPAVLTIGATYDASRQPNGWRWLLQDLSERERLLALAQAAEAKFRGIFESAPDAVLIADAAVRIVLVNQRMHDWFGYEPDELVGQPVEVLVPDSLRQAHARHRTPGIDGLRRPAAYPPDRRRP